jgi:hypothetical protein
MSGTASQNPWKTMGCKSLWDPMAEPGTEGSPNQNHRKPMAEQCREEEFQSKINPPRNIPTPDAGWRTGQSETTLRRPTPSSFRAGDILGPRCLSSLDEGSPALSALLTPSPPTVFLDPASQLTDDLLETNCDLCRHEAVNPPPSRCISLATFYLTPALTSSNFLFDEAVLGRSLANKM